MRSKASNETGQNGRRAEQPAASEAAPEWDRGERRLRQQVLADPFAPDPLAQLGYRILERFDLREAVRCFHSALGLAPGHPLASLGLELARFIRTGQRHRVTAASRAAAAALDQLPATTRDRVERLVAAPAGAGPAEGAEPPPDWLWRAATNLSARQRALDLGPTSGSPILGRRQELRLLLRAVQAMDRGAVVLTAEDGVRASRIVTELASQLSAELCRLGAPQTIWQLAGPLERVRGDVDGLLDDLGAAAASGNRVFCPEFARLLEHRTPAQLEQIFCGGWLITATSSRALDSFSMALSGLQHGLRVVRLEHLDEARVVAALQAERQQLRCRLGLSPSLESLRQAARLAEHFLADEIQPESVVQLLERCPRDPAQQTARGPKKKTLRLTAARIAGLPPDAAVAGPRLDPRSLARKLAAAASGHDALHRQLAQHLAAGCAVGAPRAGTGGAAAALLLCGPRGAGKQRVARAISQVMFGQKRYLHAPLAELVGPAVSPGAGRDAGPAHRVLASLHRRNGFAVLHVDGLEHCDPSAQLYLAQALEAGFLGGPLREVSLRRTVLVVDAPGSADQEVAGFLPVSGEQRARGSRQAPGVAPELAALLVSLRVDRFARSHQGQLEEAAR